MHAPCVRIDLAGYAACRAPPVRAPFPFPASLVPRPSCRAPLSAPEKARPSNDSQAAAACKGGPCVEARARAKTADQRRRRSPTEHKVEHRIKRQRPGLAAPKDQGAQGLPPLCPPCGITAPDRTGSTATPPARAVPGGGAMRFQPRTKAPEPVQKPCGRAPGLRRPASLQRAAGQETLPLPPSPSRRTAPGPDRQACRAPGRPPRQRGLVLGSMGKEEGKAGSCARRSAAPDPDVRPDPRHRVKMPVKSQRSDPRALAAAVPRQALRAFGISRPATPLPGKGRSRGQS